MTGNGDLHAQMDRLVGTWQTSGAMLGNDENAGETWSGYDIYEWFPERSHLVHRVDVQIFGERKEAMEFLSPSEDLPDVIEQISLANDGSVDGSRGHFDEQGNYVNTLDGARAVLNFVDETTMRAKWERLSDGTWVDWMELRFTRVGEPHIEVRSKEDHTR